MSSTKEAFNMLKATKAAKPELLIMRYSLSLAFYFSKCTATDYIFNSPEAATTEKESAFRATEQRL